MLFVICVFIFQLAIGSYVLKGMKELIEPKVKIR